MQDQVNMKPYRQEQALDHLLDLILDERIDSDTFSHFVQTQWLRSQFVFNYSNIASLNQKIFARAKRVKITLHGRDSQPVGTSRHLFGSDSSVSVRLVYDPPTNEKNTESIEFHTHPVDSIIVIMQGHGDFFLNHQNAEENHLISIPISPGVVICFPDRVIHTMEIGNVGISTLNITNYLNQPPLRQNLDTNTKEIENSPICSPNFSTSVNSSFFRKTINYADWQHYQVALPS